MLEEITPEQKSAIKEFWAKAKPKGWKYTKQIKATMDNALIITLIDPYGNKHYLQVTVDGKAIFMPVAMVSKDGMGVF